MYPLNRVSAGRYRIVKIATPCRSAQRRLMMLGVFEGDEIDVIKSAPGPVIFEKNGTRIGMGQGPAAGIMVEQIKEDK
jgi:Fe2+ transport system protein FeoA